MIERGIFKNQSTFCSYLLQSNLLDSEKNLNTINHKSIIQEVQKEIEFTTLVFIIENDTGEFKGSLRTFDPRIDLNSICCDLVLRGKFLKGGGHTYSSGFKTVDNPHDIFEAIADEIEMY